MNKINLEDPVGSIKNAVSTDGYIVTKVNDLEEFKFLCESLGNVPQYTDVHLQEGKNQYTYIPDSVPFHTDNPKMQIVGWFCISQDAQFGESLLMDVRTILAQMTDEEKHLLANQMLKMPSRDELYPLLIQGLLPHIFYIPFYWLQAAQTMEIRVREAVLRFHRLVLAERAAGGFESIRLKPGEALFINNRFIIHGRDQIDQNSQRLLVRAYIE